MGKENSPGGTSCGKISGKCGKELGQVKHQNKYLLFQKRTLLGATKVLCFQGEERNFKGPLQTTLV